MIRTFNIIMVCSSLAVLTGVYALKYTVGETASEKIRLEKQIEKMQGELSLLQADWAYLNQPAHVGPIVKRHLAVLNLQSTKPEQFGGFDQLPMRPIVQQDTAALDELFLSLDAGIDPIEQLIRAAE
jgi:hypothetical protein